MRTRSQILVLHALTENSSQTVSVRDVELASSLTKYGDVTFVNIFAVDPEVCDGRFELLIVSDSVMCKRGGALWRYLSGEIKKFAFRSNSIAMLVQDDYQLPNLIIQIAEECGATIFSALSQFEYLYAGSSVSVAPWSIAMTDNRLDKRLKALTTPWLERKIDLGTRVNQTSVRFGVEGRQKATFAFSLGVEAARVGFSVDISDRPEKRLTGEEWLQFLSNSKFTANRPGGASRVVRRIRDILFDESLTNVYSGKSFESQLDKFNSRSQETAPMLAISPRFIEAAGLNVVQLVQESPTRIGLRPWEHYVPVKSDFSNLTKVFEFMRSTEPQAMAERCRNFVFGSELFSCENWYSQMAVHFGLKAQTEVSGGSLRLLPSECLLRSKIDAYQTYQKSNKRRLSGREIRKISKQTGCPTSAFIYPWISVNVGALESQY